MPHTAPDGSWLGKLSTLYGLQDQSEVIARLSRFTSLDRRGNLIFFEDFADGAGAGKNAVSGTDAAICLSGYETKFGPFSLKLTGGSSKNYFATYYYYLPIPVLSKVGIETIWRADSNIDYFLIDCAYYSETQRIDFELKVDYSNGYYAYKNSAGGYTAIYTPAAMITTANFFQQAKLTVDLVAEEYMRLIVGGVETSIADIAMRTATGTYTPALYVYFGAFSNSGVNGVVYLDAWLVTQNED